MKGNWTNHRKGKDHYKYQHGKSDVKNKHPLYTRWQGILNSVRNPKFSSYPSNGAKGIKVCKEWEDFLTFFNWAITHGYTKKRVLTRIDKTKDFSPDNCKFLSWKKRNELYGNNNEPKIKVVYEGKSYSIIELSKKLDIPYGTLYGRITYSYVKKNNKNKTLTYENKKD